MSIKTTTITVCDGCEIPLRPPLNKYAHIVTFYAGQDNELKAHFCSIACLASMNTLKLYALRDKLREEQDDSWMKGPTLL